jgi:hypothetical protein
MEGSVWRAFHCDLIVSFAQRTAAENVLPTLSECSLQRSLVATNSEDH